jgi:predicted nucleic acid-binding protein
VKGWLVDASVLLAREDVDDVNHADARRLLAGPDAIATLDLALYETTNVAVVAWKDSDAARRLRVVIDAIADDGGLVRAKPDLLAEVARLAEKHGLSAYDAAYVAAAASVGVGLVSCDVRDLVSAGLAVLPVQAAPPEHPHHTGAGSAPP